MPTPRANDRNRERMDADEPGFAEARRLLAEARAENQAEAEAFGERTEPTPVEGDRRPLHGGPVREPGESAEEA